MDAKILDTARRHAEVCKIFSNVNRILILWLLENQELSVSDIAKAIDSSLQNTSQNLRFMKDKGILASRREGHTIYYHVLDCNLKKKLLLRNTAQEASRAHSKDQRASLFG